MPFKTGAGGEALPRADHSHRMLCVTAAGHFEICFVGYGRVICLLTQPMRRTPLRVRNPLSTTHAVGICRPWAHRLPAMQVLKGTHCYSGCCFVNDFLGRPRVRCRLFINS